MKLASFEFLADENIKPDVVKSLRAGGVSIESVWECGLQGRPDCDLLRHCFLKHRVLLTQDSDFGTLAIAQGQSCFGIVCVRPADIESSGTRGTITSVLDAELDIEPPFIVAAERCGARVSIRLRRL